MKIKIAYIVPGAGGSFYCGNCFRDSSFIKAFIANGHDIITVPMYLPVSLEEGLNSKMSPVFFGAVNMYLKQVYPILRKSPKWLTKILDSEKLLKIAAGKAGSTRATGLEEMTISMLDGENGNQKNELSELVNWLKLHHKPDIVHISNALLAGLAPMLKSELNTKIVCSLQDEDEWVDVMSEPFRTATWKKIKENSEAIDAFVSVSKYFKKTMIEKSGISADKISVIYNGVDAVDESKQIKNASKGHVLGFMSRMNNSYGVDIITDAFILLHKKFKLSNFRLNICGGYTSDDKQDIKQAKNKIKNEGLENLVTINNEFSQKIKEDFFNEITVFSVPARRPEAFGIHLLEAISAGAPVVEPDNGAYSEIIGLTQAGIIYNKNTPELLAEAIFNLCSDNELYNKLSANCKNGINNNFNSKKQVAQLTELYTNLLTL